MSASVKHVVQVLLPLDDQDGNALPRELFERTRAELVERFGGITAYSGAPAQGVWKEDGGTPVLDRIIMVEVQVENLERDWWSGYRKVLELRFKQKTILVRAIACEVP